MAGGQPARAGTGTDSATPGISECLVLSGRDGSAVWTYDLFVISKKIIPAHLFPFAVDDGGDCFLVDCSSP
jgi:hypothetical protein